MGAYEDALARRAVAARAPERLAGSSGYFAPRGATLDPSLFDQREHLYPQVRRLVLTHLYSFWERLYRDPHRWSTVWLAGSGITTAWNADREADGAPGDLDALIGVDYPAFYQANPSYQGNGEDVLARHFNAQLHDGLWPATAHQRIGGSTYELTYYVNPGATDIRAINPYAAYNVTDDSWTVRPVEVPVGFSADYFSPEERSVVQWDAMHAQATLGRFHQLQSQLANLPPNAPEYVNLARQLHEVVRAGADAFDTVHEGRHDAFAPEGKGYFDFANYRWQGGKASGAVPAMRFLKQLDQAAHNDLSEPCSAPGHLLMLAALANGGRH